MTYVTGAALILTFFVLKLLYNYVNIIVIAAAIEKGITKGVSKLGKKVSGKMPGLRENGGREGTQNAQKQQHMQGGSGEQGQGAAAK